MLKKEEENYSLTSCFFQGVYILLVVIVESFKIESFNDAREEIMRKVAETVLRAAKEKAQKAGANNIKTAIGTGDPATSILSFAKRRKMDMIVIGTRGLGKLKGKILGSVSRKVTNNAETSCLIVR